MFYSCTIERVMTVCITAWYGNCSASDKISEGSAYGPVHHWGQAPCHPGPIYWSCKIESITTGCIIAWYGNCSASNNKALHRVVHTAQYITGAKLPAIQDVYTTQCQRKALKIV